MAQGDQLTRIGDDEHLIKRCLDCGGDVWCLVQDRQIATVARGTCTCRRAHVLFDVVGDGQPLGVADIQVTFGQITRNHPS